MKEALSARRSSLVGLNISHTAPSPPPPPPPSSHPPSSQLSLPNLQTRTTAERVATQLFEFLIFNNSESVPSLIKNGASALLLPPLSRGRLRRGPALLRRRRPSPRGRLGLPRGPRRRGRLLLRRGLCAPVRVPDEM